MPTNRPSDPASERRRPDILWGNVAFLTITPLLAAVAVPWYAATHGVGWAEIGACALMWLVTGLSVTAGYHRLFAHRSYEAPAPIRALFAVLGAAAYENSVITWAADHRRHHRFVDTEQDPYNAQRGFFYSHMGWIMLEGVDQGDTSNVPDLLKDPILRWQHRHVIVIGTAVNLASTVALGLLTGRMLGMFVFALLLRLVLTQHFTFLINSAAHTWGSQPYSTAHSARDNWFLSFLSFGEGYHNYHHSFQADYRNGPKLFNWDPSKWLIWTMARIGLASKLKRSALDVTLTKIFEHARSTFDERLASAGVTLDDWRSATRDRAGEARESMQVRIVAAEQRCEEALAELKAARASLQSTIADGVGFIERRRWRQTLRQARRAAREALREWQTLGQAYLQATAAAPAPARGHNV